MEGSDGATPDSAAELGGIAVADGEESQVVGPTVVQTSAPLTPLAPEAQTEPQHCASAQSRPEADPCPEPASASELAASAELAEHTAPAAPAEPAAAEERSMVAEAVSAGNATPAVEPAPVGECALAGQAEAATPAAAGPEPEPVAEAEPPVPKAVLKASAESEHAVGPMATVEGPLTAGSGAADCATTECFTVTAEEPTTAAAVASQEHARAEPVLAGAAGPPVPAVEEPVTAATGAAGPPETAVEEPVTAAAGAARPPAGFAGEQMAEPKPSLRGPVTHNSAAVPPEAAASVLVEASGNRTPPLPTVPPLPGSFTAAAGPQAADEFEEVQDFSGEPLESRFESKDLNRRCSAYAEASAEMAKAEDASDAVVEGSIFALVRRHVSTLLAETLPKGQDAALGMLTVYLERCPGLHSEDTAAEVLPLVRKLIEHKSIDKPKMQQLAPPVVVLVAEICECQGTLKEILEALAELEGAKKKTQGFLKKQIAFSIKLIYQLIAEFGLPKMSPKLGYLPSVVKYIADSDRGIREACYSVLVELSAWLGDMPDAAKAMEEPQKKELAKRLAALSEEEKTRTEAKRLCRREQLQQASTSSSGAGAGAKQTDRYDCAEAVDALRKLPKGWCIEKVFSMEKWKEKQLHLQVLSAAVDAKRLVPCEGYAALVPALQRLLKTESNIPVLTEAAKCVGLVAKGLRGEFDRPARQLLPSALGRILDKSVWKPNVLIERIEQLLWAVPFEVFLEEARQYLASKSVWAKKEAMGLILKTLDLPQVQLSCPDAAQRFFPTLAAALLPGADDSDNGVRHEACRFLAVLVHRNLKSPNVWPLVLERLPVHRQSSFEEEWRKLGVDEPCPLAGDERPRATSQPSAGGRRAAGGAEASSQRSRPTSPLQGRSGSPLQVRPTSPGRLHERKVAESPSKLRQPVATKEGHSSAPLRSRSSDNCGQPAEEQSILESSIVKEMAEEIRNLRSAVARLEKAQEPSAAVLVPGAAASRLRTPEPRVGTHSRGGGRDHGVSTTSPRQPVAAAPSRALSASRTEEGEVAVPDRRLSGHSGCGSPRPQRSAAAASSRISTPRASSGEARISREGSATSLRRDASAQALAAGPNFRIEPPRQPKQTRQQRDRCQHWGPEPIAAEHLMALKESWKACVPERLYRCMFSDRMEEQLLSLQCWKQQVSEQIDGAVEVLDMVLKWLTWMLFNTNTQVWKLVLEVLGGLLDRLVAAEVVLTDREAQILVMNVLERSGHNIVSIRDNMMSILRQTLLVHPRLKLLPLILLALASKNKRSAACAMRLLGDALDRQVAATLARSQKDLGVVLKMVDEKDPDVRRAAIHVVASLSQHLDGDAFSRIVQSMPKSTQPIIRSATARLPPSAEEPQVLEERQPREPQAAAPASVAPSRLAQGIESPTPAQRRSTSAASAGLQSPSRVAHTAHSPGKAAGRPLSARQAQEVPTVGPLAPVATAPEPAVQSQAPVQSSATLSTSTPEAQQVSSLARRLVQCGGEDFRSICGMLKQRVRYVTEADAIPLAEALVHAMRMYFGHDGCADRCMPLVELLDEFCASKDCLRPLPTSLLRGMLKEQLRNLQYSSWTKRVENGSVILRTLNLSCVMLLNGINRRVAYSLLLELGTEESEAVHSSLVVKCLRKLNKSLTTCRNPDVEVQAALDVIKQWLQKVQPRLAQAPAEGREKGMVESAAAALMDGVKEVVDTARNTSAPAAAAWASRAEGGEELRLLREWILTSCSQGEKENLPTATSGTATRQLASPRAGSPPSKEGGSPAPLKRRVSSPAKFFGSPCKSRNAIA